MADQGTAIITLFTEFYFFMTIVLMFFIHIGFCMYEVGVVANQEPAAHAAQEHDGDPGRRARIPALRHVDVHRASGLAGRLADRELHDRLRALVREARAEPVRSHLRRLLGGLRAVRHDGGLDRLGLDHRARQDHRLPHHRRLRRRRVVGDPRGLGLVRQRLDDAVPRLPRPVLLGGAPRAAGFATLGVLLALGPRIGKFGPDGYAARNPGPQSVDGHHRHLHDLCRLLRLLRRLPHPDRERRRRRPGRLLDRDQHLRRADHALGRHPELPVRALRRHDHRLPDLERRTRSGPTRAASPASSAPAPATTSIIPSWPSRSPASAP